MKSGHCPKCKSADVMAGIEVSSPRQGNLQAAIDTRTIALIIQDQVTQPLRAWICGACGFTELYAANPEILLEADRQYPRSAS